MTQISRPFQIALLAMGLFVAVWFIALRGHSASTGGSGASSSSSSSPAQAGKAATTGAPASSSASGAEKAAAAPTPIYHGAAPGVAGLTRAIAKAHEAVATSQENAKQLERSSAQASGSSVTSGAGASTTPNPHAPATTTSSGSSTAPRAGAQGARERAAATRGAAASKAASSGARAARPGSAKASRPAMQATVERELKHGKVATILFWNSRASVDESVHRELQAVGRSLGGQIAVHNARAAQVGSFGSITRTVRVYQTPTILIVNPHGQTTTLTGLEDVFSIEQAIDEAQS
jgi:hypothetical protein